MVVGEELQSPLSWLSLIVGESQVKGVLFSEVEDPLVMLVGESTVVGLLLSEVEYPVVW